MFRRRPMRKVLFTVAVGLPAAVLIASVFAVPVAALQTASPSDPVATAAPSPSLCLPAGLPTSAPGTSLPPLPTQTLASTASPLPLPSTSPSAAARLPSPSPSLPVAACATPSASPGGSPPSTSVGTPGGDTASRGPGLAATSLSPSTLQDLNGGFLAGDPSLWSQVATILRSPLSAAAPDLVHFPDLQPASAPKPIGDAAQRRAGSGPPVLGTAGVLGAGFLLAVLVLLRWRRQPRRSLRGMAWLCSAVAAVIFGTAGLLELSDLHGLSPTASIAAPSSAQTSSREQSVSAAVPSAAVTSLRLPTGAWSTLSGIEISIAQTQRSLTENEAEIAQFTTATAQPAATATDPDEPRDLLRPERQPTPTSLLTQLLAAHQSLAAAYTQELQAEYAVYVAAAESPAQTAELESAAAPEPAPIQQAVATDIAAVRTQLAQEAAVAAATAQAGGGFAAGSTTSGAAPALTLPAAAQVTLHAPLSGVVTQPFGSSSLAMELPMLYDGVFYQHFHTGIDIAAPLDTPVGAAAAGRVIFAGQSRDAAGHLVGYGNYVMVEHASGLVTLYGHLDLILVSVGDTVAQGQPIGLEGSTGWSTGPHLHFEVRVDRRVVDPAPYLAAEIHPTLASTP